MSVRYPDNILWAVTFNFGQELSFNLAKINEDEKRKYQLSRNNVPKFPQILVRPTMKFRLPPD